MTFATGIQSALLLGISFLVFNTLFELSQSIYDSFLIDHHHERPKDIVCMGFWLRRWRSICARMVKKLVACIMRGTIFDVDGNTGLGRAATFRGFRDGPYLQPQTRTEAGTPH